MARSYVGHPGGANRTLALTRPMRHKRRVGTDEHPEMLANRIRKNRRKLRRYLQRDAIGCYRIYDADIPEIPLAVDVYETHGHVAVYRRRGNPEGPAAVQWVDALVEAVSEACGLSADAIAVKVRERQRGLEQYERMGARGQRHAVGEGGLRFWVNLTDYLDTGLFLDHRVTRSMVREEAEGRRFLNLFAYTGSFTVYAAAGGAATTTTVDLSGTYLDWARDNLVLNGLIGPERDPRHRAVQVDALRFLAEDEGLYDLVVVDPPTFSNSKRLTDVFDVQRDHVELLSRVWDRLAPGGIVYFSTNFRRFKLDPSWAERLEDISGRTVPQDFRNRRIHRCYRGVAS